VPEGVYLLMNKTGVGISLMNKNVHPIMHAHTQNATAGQITRRDYKIPLHMPGPPEKLITLPASLAQHALFLPKSF